MLSGVEPVTLDAELNVTGVTPTFNVSFGDDITQDRVSANQLWSSGANMTLNLRGDTWDVDGRALWNTNHPRLDGSITRGDELYAFKQSVERIGGLALVVDYASVNITLRQAKLPLFPIPGLSVPFDERVRVSKVSQLILGRPTVAQENFIVTQIQPNELRVNFGGVATPSRVTGEKAFRSGFWFTVELNRQVFRENSTQWRNELFPQTTSLTPFLDDCTAMRSPLWVYNFSCPPMPTFDIDRDELINLEVPRSFYYEVLPPDTARSVIGVIAAPAPTCAWEQIIALTEGDIRSATDPFVISIRVTSPSSRVVDDPTIVNLTAGVITSTHQATTPLQITVRPRLNPKLLHLQIAPDPAYEINTDDVVTIHLNRFFFTDGERCNPLNLTVNVLPGTGFGTNMTVMNETAIRDGDLRFTITLIGERAQAGEFDLDYKVTYLPGNAQNPSVGVGLPVFGFREAFETGDASSGGAPYRVTVRAITNWTSATANETVFEGVLQRLPGYRILQPENVTLRIPGSAVASRTAPDLVNNSFIFYPSPSRLNFTGDDTVLEANVTTGTTRPMRFELLDDFWDQAATPALLRTLAERTAANGVTLDTRSTGILARLFSADAFSFPDASTMVVTLQRDDTYNAVTDEDITIYFSAAMTVSGIAPEIANVSVRVLAGTPQIIATGSALNAGSRAFILGGLSLELYLENDLFIPQVLLPQDICPFGQCVISLSNTQRVLTVSFQPTLTTVLTANATFNVFVRRDAVLTGAALNNVTLQITLEPGLATLTFNGLPSVVTEQTIARGQLPPLLLNLVGDRFVPDPDRLARALTQGTSCFPASDRYGFCQRARAVFTTIEYRFFAGLQTASLTLQADEQYDIFVNEVVNISIGALGLESGLAPTGWTSLSVQPVRGSYFFSATTTSVPSAVLRTDDSLNVELTIALRNERFVEDPVPAMIESARSTQSEQDQGAGFERLKTTMFFPGVLSEDRRVLRLRFRRTPNYQSSTDEAITFRVPSTAVLSPTAPTLSSPGATIVIAHSGGTLTLLSPTTTTVDRVRRGGINVTVLTSDAWDTVDTSELNRELLRDKVFSDRPPAAEPHGFAALRDAMLPRSVVVNDRLLEMQILPAAAYDLQSDERITILFNEPQWGVQNRPMFPDSFTIRVVAKPEDASSAGFVVAFLPAPVDEGELQRAIARFVGVTTDTVVITSNVEYDLEGRYRRVGIDFVVPGDDGSGVTTAPGRSPSEAARFLVNSDEGLLQSQLNVSALYLGSAPMSSRDVDLRLQLRREEYVVRPEESLIWVWVAIGVLCAAAIAAAVIYYVRLRGRMQPAASKHGRTAPMLKLKAEANAEDLPQYLSEELMDDGKHAGNEDDLLASYVGGASWEERGGRMSPSPSPGRSASPGSPPLAAAGLLVTPARAPRGGAKPKSADDALDALLLESGGRAAPRSAVVIVDTDGSISGRGASKHADTQQAAARHVAAGRFADNDELIAGPSLAGTRARAVKIDLDEFVDSKQPAGFLRPAIEPMPIRDIKPDPTPSSRVGIYAPGTPASAKFRTRSVDHSRLL